MFEQVANALLLEWLFQKDLERYPGVPDNFICRRVFFLRLQTVFG